MALHKQIEMDATPPEAGGWTWGWPNTADFNFNFYTLLDNAASSAIAQATSNPHIAILGAGIAGLTAARELFRCGYTNIHIYEASDRIGGRNWSTRAPDQPSGTAYEMGAMRMPFFPAPGSRNSALDYYRGLYQIDVQPFPDPAVVKTGIYINNGFGPEPETVTKPELLIWDAGAPKPPTKALQDLLALWTAWSSNFIATAKSFYGGPEWEAFWHGVVGTYWELNFRELVFLAPERDPAKNKAGNFGGLGMTQQQADLFYVIGAGDGSWGAFYDVSSLYPIRTLLFGYGTNHQLIKGRPRLEGEKEYKAESLADGATLSPPAFLGIQAFSECMFWLPVESPFVHHVSLAEPGGAYDVKLFLKTPVSALAQAGEQIALTAGGRTINYDHVIITPTTWAFEMSVDTSTLPFKNVLPVDVQNSLKESHWITSCKVFFPLTKRYWEASSIPQVITTDTYLQDVYGYAVGDDPGVALVSYTWEDDASKLEASDDGVLAATCLTQLDTILARTGYPALSPFVDQKRPVVIHWERQPTYRGCAKLYRERSWDMDYALLTYNQTYSAKSHLYFAGEGYSVEGGWTEPALRLALDAVIHVVHNSGGKFLNGFSFDLYPKYPSWSPVDSAPPRIARLTAARPARATAPKPAAKKKAAAKKGPAKKVAGRKVAGKKVAKKSAGRGAKPAPKAKKKKTKAGGAAKGRKGR